MFVTKFFKGLRSTVAWKRVSDNALKQWRNNHLCYPRRVEKRNSIRKNFRYIVKNRSKKVRFIVGSQIKITGEQKIGRLGDGRRFFNRTNFLWNCELFPSNFLPLWWGIVRGPWFITTEIKTKIRISKRNNHWILAQPCLSTNMKTWSNL